MPLPVSPPEVISVSSEFPQHRKPFQPLVRPYFITQVHFYTTVALTISLWLSMKNCKMDLDLNFTLPLTEFVETHFSQSWVEQYEVIVKAECGTALDEEWGTVKCQSLLTYSSLNSLTDVPACSVSLLSSSETSSICVFQKRSWSFMERQQPQSLHLPGWLQHGP